MWSKLSHQSGGTGSGTSSGRWALGAQRQKLWEKLTSDPDVAAKCQILDGKSDEEKLHSMLNEEFWGVDVDEESGLVYGPFKHAFKCIAKYVAAAWKIRNAYAHPSDVA